jgi:hypothetical protein
MALTSSMSKNKSRKKDEAYFYLFYVSLKRRLTFNGLHGVTAEKIDFFEVFHGFPEPFQTNSGVLPEESPLLEAVTRERLVKTGWKRLSGCCGDL